MAHDFDLEMRNAVEAFIRGQFPSNEIARIVIEPAGDVDGESIVNVRVEFVVKPETSKLRNLVREVRSDINSRLDAFPVFSFASRNALVGAAA